MCVSVSTPLCRAEPPDSQQEKITIQKHILLMIISNQILVEMIGELKEDSAFILSYFDLSDRSCSSKRHRPSNWHHFQWRPFSLLALFEKIQVIFHFQHHFFTDRGTVSEGDEMDEVEQNSRAGNELLTLRVHGC